MDNSSPGLGSVRASVPDLGGTDVLDLVDAVRPGVLRSVVQPVVRLADDTVVGYEALLRLPDGEVPESLLQRAQDAGVRPAVELACLRAAASLGTPPAGRLLFVNLGPGVLEHPDLPEVVRSLPSRLVLEITEHQALPARASLVELLAPLLDGGARLAVDDTGSGYASLEHVVELRPEFLKLSSRLVTGLDRDPARLALVRALAAFAREVGASIVAEGVEREGERAALLAAGVEHAQGWLLARPGPPWPELAARPSHARASVALPPDPGAGELAAALGRCPDARTACQALVAHLARHPGWMPSVYLQVAGRLRLQAQHGYWHVIDGMPCTAGVMGRTQTSGLPAFVRDVTQEPDYVDAVPGLASEMSQPLRVDGTIVGVVNVESAVTLPDSVQQEVATCADLLGARLADVGVPGESRARLLGRHTAELTAAAGAGEVRLLQACATTAVQALSGLGSAMLAGPGPEGMRVEAASGPLADALLALDAVTLGAMLGSLSSGQTGYTAGTIGGRAPGTQGALTAANVRTVIALPVGETHLLVGADRDTSALVAEDVELLEVLAGQLAGCLQTVAAVAALRERAEQDPLTGLGNRARFRRTLDELGTRAFAVAYVDVDRFKLINDQQGHAEGDRILVAVADVLDEQSRAGDRGVFRLGGDEFAAVLPDLGLEEASDRAQTMLQAVREAGLGVSVSIGVAAGAAAEPVHHVLARADAALYDAKDAGRDRVRLRSAPVPQPA